MNQLSLRKLGILWEIIYDKNDSDEEKLENSDDCELGEELKDFMNEVAKEISKSTTVPTSDS